MLASFVSEACTQAIVILVILIHPPSLMGLLEATTLIDTLALPLLPLLPLPPLPLLSIPLLPIPLLPIPILPIPLTLLLVLGLS